MADPNRVVRQVTIGLLMVTLAAVAIVVLANPRLIVFQPFTVAEFLADFAPLLLVALFIERALEVFLTAWRAEEADRLDTALAHAKARAAAAAAAAEAREAVEQREQDLKAYKAATRRLALSAGIALGVVVAAIGVRGLEIFVDPAELGELGRTAPLQAAIFRTADAVLTGALLGGGADGIHKLVSVFTDFLDLTRKRQAAAAGGS